MWEHMVIKIDFPALPPGTETEAIQRELDEANLDGWELVSTSWIADDYYYLYLFFKREVE